MLHEFLRARRPYEAVDVDVDEGRHEELAIESIHDAPVAWDDVPKVLYLKCPLEAAGKKPSEGSEKWGYSKFDPKF